MELNGPSLTVVEIIKVTNLDEFYKLDNGKSLPTGDCEYLSNSVTSAISEL